MENYRCFGRIGEGAHGVVYQAQEIKSGQKVALKKIPLKRLEDGLPIQGQALDYTTGFFKDVRVGGYKEVVGGVYKTLN